MKKNYIRPESKLFAINLDENIAQPSGGNQNGGTSGSTGGINYIIFPDGSGYFAGNESWRFFVDSETEANIMDAFFLCRYEHGPAVYDCM